MRRIPALLIFITLCLQAAIAYKLFFPTTPAVVPAVRSARPNTTLAVTGMPSKGSPTAKAVMIEFSDFECPFCKRYATGAQLEIFRAYVDSGRLRYVFANYPLVDLHPNATMMAAGAICASKQNRYWDMHAQLFAEQPKSQALLVDVARNVKIDVDAFKECINDGETGEVIKRDMAAATSLGINSTPTFALGTEVDGKINVTTFVSGVQPYPVFKDAIDKLLSSKTIAMNAMRQD